MPQDRRRWRTAWEWWSHIDTAGGLPGWFSWAKPWLLSAMSAVGLGGWTARATHWPLSVIVIVFLAAFASVLLLWNQLSVALNNARTPTSAADDITTRKIRRLEYHAMHLVWIRALLLDRTKSEAAVDDAHRVVEKHRAQLLDLTPSLFTQSEIEAFRSLHCWFCPRRNSWLVASLTREPAPRPWPDSTSSFAVSERFGNDLRG